MSTPGNITVVIKNLKRDDWITSILNPDDKRASILTITEKGTKVIEKVFPIFRSGLYLEISLPKKYHGIEIEPVW